MGVFFVGNCIFFATSGCGLMSLAQHGAQGVGQPALENKAVRELTALGLVEAKKLVESAPATIKEALPKDASRDMVKKLPQGFRRS